jgi:hypothetical protein
MKPRTPSLSDAEVGALLLAMRSDLVEDGAVDVSPAVDDDPAEVEAAFQRFWERLPGIGAPETEQPASPSVGSFVTAARGDEPQQAFAARLGITAFQLDALESCAVMMIPDDVDRSAKAAASTVAVPHLKVLRVLKAAAARGAPSNAGALLRAARTKPPGDHRG